MPEFCDPFVALNANGEIDHEELVRLIRLAIASEGEAIQIYTQIAEATTNDLAKKVLMDVVHEEKVHIGSFLKLMKTIEPEEFKYYDKGMKEADELMAGK
ncbi:MAG: ferritin family protein [Alphaproteobacteria bacterium]|jgi:rubrerythrin